MSENIERMRWLTVRAALKLEVKTGMRRSSRGRTTLALANEITGVPSKTKKAAYEELNKKIASELGPEFSRPLG